MRFELGENLGRRATELFREEGHDVTTVVDQRLGGATDERLVSVCKAERRILGTLDLGFSNILRFPPQRYAGIAVPRMPHPMELDDLEDHARVLLEAVKQEDPTGGLWIVEAGRIRQHVQEDP